MKKGVTFEVTPVDFTPASMQEGRLPIWGVSCLLCRAEDGTQTRDPQLGRLMLYQLSYFRKTKMSFVYIIMPFEKIIISLFRQTFLVGSDGFEPPKA